MSSSFHISIYKLLSFFLQLHNFFLYFHSGGHLAYFRSFTFIKNAGEHSWLL